MDLSFSTEVIVILASSPLVRFSLTDAPETDAPKMLDEVTSGSQLF